MTTAERDYAHSSYATSQREAKAAALEAQLRRSGIPLAAARTLPPASRRNVERAAGVRRSSDETWERAFAFMAEHEARHRPPQLVTTSCRGCMGTILVPVELFDRYRFAYHSDVGGVCPDP